MALKEEFVVDTNGDVLLGTSWIMEEANPQVIYFSACLHAIVRRCV